MGIDLEQRRLEELHRYHILDTPPEPEFDCITVVAAKLFGTETAAVTLIDETRQWFKSRFGLPFQETRRAIAFCSRTIEHDDVLVVLDATKDPRFASNPLVVGAPRISFYAGAPLRTSDGFKIGSLAIIDSRPRAEFSDADRALLRRLAAIVVDEMEARRRRLRSDAAGSRSAPTPSQAPLLFDQLPAIVWTTDLALRVTSLSGAGLAAFAVDPRDIVGQPIVTLLDRDQPPRGPELHQRVLAGESIAIDGRWRGRSYAFRLEPLRDAGGGIIGVAGLALDITERIEAERALQVSEKRLRELLGCTDGALFELDRAGTYLNIWTDREDLLERPRQELIGRTIEEVLGTNAAAPFLARIARTLETGVKQTFEYGMTGQAGERWLLADAVPLSENGTVALMVRDISARRAVEEQFRVTQRRLKHLLSEGPAVIYSSNLAGRFAVTFMSDNVEELTGYRASEFIHDPSFWINRVHPDDASAMMEAMLTATATGAYAHDYRFRCSDGRYRWIHDELRVLRRPDGGMLESIGFWTDVDDLKRSEAALRESEQRYQLISRATNDVIWDWDLATNRVWWNEGLYTKFAYAPGDVGETAEWWIEQLSPEDRERVAASIHAAIDHPTASSWSEEYRFLRGDGALADVLDRGFILRGADGKAVRMVGAMIDLTERKRMQAQVMQSDRLASVGTLASGVAHEINNPLAYVLTNVSFAREVLDEALDRAHAPGAPPPSLEEARLALVDAESGARRVREIVRDLKVFARGDDLRATSVDVARVVESALAMALNAIRHCAKLERDFGAVPPVVANESQLAQVFLNLAINAAQAIGEGHAAENTIRITTRTDARGWACVDVEDTGPGIAPSVVGRIFDPFFTTKQIGVGTGLGLSICHGIVTALGGSITVASRPERGAKFTVCLPAARETPAAIAAPPPAVTTGERRRVLVIDDDPAVVRTIERTLGGEHDVTSCLSGREALDLVARDQRFDVILCDLMMPDFAGMDVYRALETAHPELARRTIFMSGGAFTPRARQFLECVANPRIEKPFDVETLRALVRRAR